MEGTNVSVRAARAVTGRFPMALYVGLAKMTREGASRIRDLAPEYAKARQYIESVGGKIICMTACFGEFDFVSVIDYPDQVAALKAAGYGDVARLGDGSNVAGVRN